MTFEAKQSRLSLAALCSILIFASVSDALLSRRPASGLHVTSSTSFISPSFLRYPQTSQKPPPLFASSVSSSSKKKKSKSKAKSNSNAKTTEKDNSRRKPGPGRSLSQEELTDHVQTHQFDRRGTLTMDDFDMGDSMDDEEESSSSIPETAEQAEFLKELNRRPALVLNADFQPLCYLPLSLWSWQDAVKAIFSGKVTVVDVYPDVSVRAANLEVPLPSVIALTDYVAHKNQRPAFTRRNVFLRDEYKCQYCNDRFHTADLSLDHVVPRCMGGTLSWENAVTSCLKCNGRKGSIPVTELRSIGMRLMREPRCPTQMELAAKAARMVPRRVHPTWKPFLGIAETPKTMNSPSSSKTGDEEFIDDRYFEESD